MADPQTRHTYEITTSSGNVYHVEANNDEEAGRLKDYLEQRSAAGDPDIKDQSSIPDNAQVVRPTAPVQQASGNTPAVPEGLAPDAWLNSNFGTGLRAAVHGVAAVPETLFDSVVGSGQTRGALDMMMDQAGLGRPESREGRIASEAISGLTGALATGGVGGLLEKAPVAGASWLGNAMKSAPVLNAAGGALGGAAGATVRENGGTPGEQLAASLIGGVGPGLIGHGAAAVTRAALVGNNQPKLQQAIKDFAESGAGTPSLGQGTDSDKIRGAESWLSQFVGSSDIMRGSTNKQAAGIGDAVEAAAGKLAPNAASNEDVGSQILQDSDLFKKGARRVIDQHYDNLAKKFPPDTQVAIPEFIKFLEDKTAIDPFAMHLDQNDLLSQGKQDWATVLADARKDLKANQILGNTNGIPLSSLRKIRTKMGDLVDNAAFNKVNVPMGEAQGAYGSLSEDIKASAAKLDGVNLDDIKSGTATAPKGGALALYEKANAANGQYHDILDTIKPVIDKKGGPEQIFKQALSGTKEGGTVAQNVMNSLQPASRPLFTAAVLRRMTGDGDFNLSQFASNYTKMADTAKDALFGPSTSTYRQHLDTIADTAHNILSGVTEHGQAGSPREGRFGAYQILQGLGAGGGATIGGIAAQNPTLTAGGLGTLGIVGTAVGGSRALSHALTSPTVVKWLAENNKIPKDAIPAAVNQLAQQARRNDDPQAADLAAEIQASLKDE